MTGRRGNGLMAPFSVKRPSHIQEIHTAKGKIIDVGDGCRKEEAFSVMHQ